MPSSRKRRPRKAAKKSRGERRTILMPSQPPYNLLDKMNLGKSVADALLLVPVSPMSSITDINGAGVYAIYYTGKFLAYAPIAALNKDGRFEAPIYVGKAI